MRGYFTREKSSLPQNHLAPDLPAGVGRGVDFDVPFSRQHRVYQAGRRGVHGRHLIHAGHLRTERRHMGIRLQYPAARHGEGQCGGHEDRAQRSKRIFNTSRGLRTDLNFGPSVGACSLTEQVGVAIIYGQGNSNTKASTGRA